MISSNFDHGIRQTFVANFTAAASLALFDVPKRMLTAKQFTNSTYDFSQTNDSAVAEDVTGK